MLLAICTAGIDSPGRKDRCVAARQASRHSTRSFHAGSWGRWLALALPEMQAIRVYLSMAGGGVEIIPLDQLQNGLQS